MDVLCQAKSGMGKTAVFVLSILQQLEPPKADAKDGKPDVVAVVLCHTRELAFQVGLGSLRSGVQGCTRPVMIPLLCLHTCVLSLRMFLSPAHA